MDNRPQLSNGRGGQIVLLIAAVLAANFSRTVIGPLQEAMRVSLSLSDNQMALLQGPAVALAVVVAGIPFGLAADRRSRVRLLFALSVLDVAASVLTALAPNFTVLAIARFLVSLAMSASLTAAFSLLTDLSSPQQRGRTTMMLGLSQMAGNSAAFAMGGLLLTALGPGSDAWRWALFWLTLPLVPASLLILAMREPPRTGAAIEKPSIRETWPELWRYRAVIAPVLVAMGMVEIAFSSAYVWAAPALSRTFSLAPDRVGAIMASGLLVSGVLGSLAGGVLADRCQHVGGPRRTLLVIGSVALLSAPAGLFAFANTAWSAGALLLAYFLTLSVVIVMGTALFAVVIPNELRGVCVAILYTVGALFGVGFAPLAVSLLSSALGGPDTIGKALSVVCAVSTLLAAAAFAFGRRFFTDQTPGPAESVA
jgi:MFS family permease